MNNKALYWIALGVFALGVNSEYQKGNLPLAHRVADRAGAVLCRVATRAEQTLAVARVLIGRPGAEVPADEFAALYQAEVDRVLAMRQADLDRAMDLRQADLDRVQQKLDRVHMVLDRAHFQKVRQLDRIQFRLTDATSRRVFVVCPETGARVSVDAETGLPDLEADPQ